MTSAIPATSTHLLESELKRLEQNDDSLTSLNLSVMRISDSQATDLAKALDKNTFLQMLILYENCIGSLGAQAFCTLLTRNHTLKELWLPFNRIGNEGAVWLAQGLQHNTSIQTIRLDGNCIGPEGGAALGQCLEKCQQLQELHLSENCIGNAGVKGLVAGLKNTHSNIRKLLLSDNGISNEGAIAIGDMLKCNRTLQYLLLGLNAFDQKGVDALVRGMEQNYSILHLNLFGMDSHMQDEINHFVQLNKVGRRILRIENDLLPLTLWADFIAKVSRKKKPSLLHYFVLAKPDLFQQVKGA